MGRKPGRRQAPGNGSTPRRACRSRLLLTRVGCITIVIQIGVYSCPVPNRIRVIVDIQAEGDRDLVIRVSGAGCTRIRPERPDPDDASTREGTRRAFVIAEAGRRDGRGLGAGHTYIRGTGWRTTRYRESARHTAGEICCTARDSIRDQAVDGDRVRVV